MPKLGTIGLSSFWGSDLLTLLTPWMSLTTREETAAVEILPFVSDVCSDQNQSESDLSLPAPWYFIGLGLLSCVLSALQILLLSYKHGAIN